jgi:hypothetical protein
MPAGEFFVPAFVQPWCLIGEFALSGSITGNDLKSNVIGYHRNRNQGFRQLLFFHQFNYQYYLGIDSQWIPFLAA